MLDIGWQELLVIGVLALLVVGPKELPGLLRTVGQWAGKARSVAREFQRSMEDAAREADLTDLAKLKDVKRDVENMARLDYGAQAKKAQSYMKPKPKAAAATTAAETEPAAAPEVAERPAPPTPAAPADPAPAPASDAKAASAGDRGSKA